MRTLLLNQSRWDYCVDNAGNWAVCDVPYAQAQDVASAIKLFLGELWYDTSKGVPYWQQILGRFPPVPLMKADWIKAALTVPGVVSALVFLKSVAKREVTGQVQIKNNQGQVSVATIPQNTLGFSFFFAVTETGTPGLTDTGQHIIVG